LLELLHLFIEHRVEVVRRRTQYELRKAREREHILLGYHIALDYIDDVIKIIRGSSRPRERPREFARILHEQIDSRAGGKFRANPEGRKLDAKKYGIATGAIAPGETPGLSYVQIDAILELQLHRLTRLSIDEILKELAQIRERIEGLTRFSQATKS